MGLYMCFLFHNNLHHPMHIHNCCCRHRTIYLLSMMEFYMLQNMVLELELLLES